MPRRRKEVPEADIDLRPFMNLLCILIPFLLACASFASIKVIEMALPETMSAPSAQQAPPKDKEDEGLLLTIFITDKGFTLGAKGAMLPTTYTREFHKYEYTYPKGEKTKYTFTTPAITKANKREMPLCPKDPTRRLTLFERQDIVLYAVRKTSDTDTGTVPMVCYDKQLGCAMTDVRGNIIAGMPNVGDTVYALSLEDRRPRVVKNQASYQLTPLSVYDELSSRLIKVRAQYPNVPDQGEIKIVGEDDVVFDKIVHVMDVCRLFGFPKISLAKLAG
jgi:biopolymer transport protein ExbD